MYIVRVDRGSSEDQRVTIWLRSIKPVKWGDREHAMKFPTKGEARRAAEAAKAVGWTLEDV